MSTRSRTSRLSAQAEALAAASNARATAANALANETTLINELIDDLGKYINCEEVDSEDLKNDAADFDMLAGLFAAMAASLRAPVRPAAPAAVQAPAAAQVPAPVVDTAPSVARPVLATSQPMPGFQFTCVPIDPSVGELISVWSSHEHLRTDDGGLVLATNNPQFRVVWPSSNFSVSGGGLADPSQFVSKMRRSKDRNGALSQTNAHAKVVSITPRSGGFSDIVLTRVRVTNSR